MPEETNPKHASVRLTTFILLVILVAIAFGGAGYIYGRNGVTLVDTNGVDLLTATAVTSTVPSTSATIGITTTADVAASWKTYTNSDYGFTFKYPINWEVRDQTSDNQKNNSSLKLLVGANPQNVREDMWYIVQVLSGTLDSVANKYITSASDNSTIISDTTVSKYDTQVRSIVTKNNTTSLQYTMYFVSKGNNVFQFTGPQDGTDDNTVIGNKIVDTFQFTK